MAKPDKVSAAIAGNPDRTPYYSDLSYIPQDLKQKKIFIAQSIYYAKKNSSLLVSPALASEYRGYDNLIVNPQTYKNLIDPPSPKTEGGKAEFFSSDFKPYPIDIHLDNIVRAALEKIPNNISVTIADPVAKLNEQKDKEKIIWQGIVRRFINEMNKELGLPQIQESQDPYKWAKAFTQNGEKGAAAVDTIGNPMDMIKNKIKTDDQLRMYMKYVYKNGLEIAFEAAIQYYFINLNKWHIRQDAFINDMRNFNTTTGMLYTDSTNGRPVVKYLDPASVYTSPFFEKNGDDIIYWGYEFFVNFADFERMFGAKLSDEQKKKILDVNKLWNNATNGSISVQWNAQLKTNAQLKLGYYSVLTQEAEEFSKYYLDNQGTLINEFGTGWDGEDSVNLKPNPNKIYNVWYSCYYVPLPSTSTYYWGGAGSGVNIGTESWEWLSEYVFDIQKNVDMYRYGVDQRYAKSQLVIYCDRSRPSYTNIKYHFMPKINLLWQKYQNCLVQDINAMAWDEDLMSALLSAVDTANEKDSKGGGDALLKSMKTLRQSGQSWVKFRDKNGQLIITDPSKLFVHIKSGHMETAGEYMQHILMLYNEMSKALAMSDAASAEQPDPRTPAVGIEIAAEATQNARWYLEKGMIEVNIMFGERIIQWVNCICSDKKEFGAEERWNEFVDVVGLANGATIESIEDINFENVGITVKSVNTGAIKQLITQMVTQKLNMGQITAQQWGLVLDTDNWKYQIMELAMFEDAQKEDAAKQQQAQFQQQMQLQQMQLQTALALQGAKAEGVNSNIQMAGAVDNQVNQQLNAAKAQTMAGLAAQRNAQKQQEDVLKAQLEKDKKSHEHNLDQQSAFTS